MRGARMQPGGNYKTDTVSEGEKTEAQIHTLASVNGQQVTYTSVPLGSANRMGIARDGDVNQDGYVSIADLLIVTKISLGLDVPTTAELIKGDVAPLIGGVPSPDGSINAGDYIVLQKKILGLINF